MIDRYTKAVLTVVAAAHFAIVACCGPALAEKAKPKKSKAPSYEECQKIVQARGGAGRSANTRSGASSNMMSQCMEGKLR